MQLHDFSYPHKPFCAIENMTQIEIGRQGGKISMTCLYSRPTKVAHEQYKIVPTICLERIN